jgi:hypothetical protein
MNELYDINKTSENQFDETDYFERLELLSRILSLDIQIITEDNIVDIKFEDSPYFWQARSYGHVHFSFFKIENK